MANLSPFSNFSQGNSSTFTSPFGFAREIHLAMGPCQFQGNNGFRCTCPSGECTLFSDDPRRPIFCENCGHVMDVHRDYDKRHLPLPMSFSVCIKSLTDILKAAALFSSVLLEIPTMVSPRERLVNGIIDQAEKYRLILVRGTPDCGKMNLVANELLTRRSGEIPVHIMTGWDERQVDKAEGWNEYLMQETVIKGRDWPTSCAYLCSMKLRSLTGIPLYESFDEETTDFNDQNGLGLLLEAEEASDVMKKYTDAVGPPSLSKDLMDELFLISNGHVGCLTALMGVFRRAVELEYQRRHDPQFELGTVRESIFSHPSRLFRYLNDTPFIRGMPNADILQHQDVAKVFKRTVACDEISADDFENAAEIQTLEMIWRNGWLHARKIRSSLYISQQHPSLTPLTGVIHYTTALELAIGAIRGIIIPRHLSDPPRSASGGSLPLEDQYQKEFYRSFYTLLDGRVLISPEYVAKRGKGGGTIDFLLSTKKWGFELLEIAKK
ncbi:hypothetical protein TSTA_037720 [Talaromyces stipitatus ATCC 10500]|uniref:Uncharacterized protein n=1 Tax=Talaromyces stipitatus (strain ATCC 10500 / CBS 375.48 / QM 6759 / NRRL 1006) TaxID=441959 RepID=B8M8P1_TALSN|nr:uncharacterized protein TSTA_037720 [Talaromyces stipitatus ATCC 10500]EED20554.1 hypothetical protein TSTA_037720 [Talaromyces stipitatus ATCC 10500]